MVCNTQTVAVSGTRVALVASTTWAESLLIGALAGNSATAGHTLYVGFEDTEFRHDAALVSGSIPFAGNVGPSKLGVLIPGPIDLSTVYLDRSAAAVGTMGAWFEYEPARSVSS